MPRLIPAPLPELILGFSGGTNEADAAAFKEELGKASTVLHIVPSKSLKTLTLPLRGKPTERLRIEATGDPISVVVFSDPMPRKYRRLALLAPGRHAVFCWQGSDWAVERRRCSHTAPGRRHVRCRIRHR